MLRDTWPRTRIAPRCTRKTLFELIVSFVEGFFFPSYGIFVNWVTKPLYPDLEVVHRHHGVFSFLLPDAFLFVPQAQHLRYLNKLVFLISFLSYLFRHTERNNQDYRRRVHAQSNRKQTGL